MLPKYLSRYAIQVVTHIGDSGEPTINIADRKLQKDESGYSLIMDIENVGQRWVRPVISAELYSEGGILIGSFDSGRYRIYPSTSVRANISLGKPSPGLYKLLVLIEGDDNIWGAQYSLKIDGE